MPERTATKLAPIGIRTTPERKARLEEQAAAKGRSLAHEVERLLDFALDFEARHQTLAAFSHEWRRIRVPDLPPSANALFTTRKGSSARIKTTEYCRWIDATIARVRQQTECGHNGQKAPFAVYAQAGVNRTRDLDNLIKPTLDVLVKAGATPDDRYADLIHWERTPGVDGLVIDVRHGGAR